MSGQNEENPEDLLIKTYNELGDPAPRSTSWLVVMLVVGFVISILVLAQSAVIGYRYAKLQEEFIRMTKSRMKLEEVLRSPRYLPLVRPHANLVDKLLPLFVMINAGELSRALRMLERPETPKHPFLHVLSARLRVLSGDDEVFQTLREDERYNSKIEPDLWRRYVDIKTEAASILEIPASIPESPEFTFYESGVLVGLPVFPGIPDNIPNFEGLMGFAPKLRKFNAAERSKIQMRLQSLADSGNDLAQQRGNLSLKSDKRRSTLHSMSARHMKAEREAKALIRRFAVELAYQPVPQLVRETYMVLRTFLETKHVFLPELLVIERQKGLSEAEISASLDSELSHDRF